MAYQLFLVASGGATGAVLRFLIANPLNLLFVFPLGTLIVNVVGCFIMGMILYSPDIAENPVRNFFTAGLLGAFTTLSAFSAESIRLLEHDKFWYFLMYAGGTMLFSLIGIVAGKSLIVTLEKFA